MYGVCLGWTNYKELLALCQEYQMDWLVEIIETYLIKTNRFTNGSYLHEEKFTGLLLADEFDLKELRTHIVSYSSISHVQYMENHGKLSELNKLTKYQLARRYIQSDLPMNDGKDRAAMLNFLDSYFKE